MSGVRPISRRMKAVTLLPVTLTSGLATAAVLTTTGATAAPPARSHGRPGSVHVATEAVQPQATLSQPGQVAPAVPADRVDAVVAGATTSGIPAIALNAYQRAAEVINAADPRCTMPWQLIGAIGRVESDHGQFGGNHLDARGNAVPGIYGPVLDGTRGTALIRDSDGGALDHNARYDRAVGPLQFLPSTWAVVGVDANGDGKRDPQNIDDASLATAVYLCSGHTDLANVADQRSAVYRYNHSVDYVNLVLAITKAYERGDYSSTPAGSYGAAALPLKAELPRARKATASRRKPGPPTASPTSSPSPSASTSPRPTPTKAPNLLQDLVGGLTGSQATPPAVSSSPMTSTQAARYCAIRLQGTLDLLGSLHAACTRKLTGLTPREADARWAAHQSDLGAWFTS